ncbi:hypothetical protein [Paenibacillus polymyxa]|uniref:hypothetical protein n=1 Tax=Paenibacillus polymyxa TaxID=1406 RepID=UPI000AB93F0F|nr:hypothetical protein [Paenibacillus polymyxa]
MTGIVDNVTPFDNYGYKFVIVPIWINRGNKETTKKQHCMIGLKNIVQEKQIIHPITEFIVENWLGRSYNTQRKHANNLVYFLNYIISNMNTLRIVHYRDLSLEHGTLFLNWLSQNNKKRETVISYERTLTHFFLWLSKKGVLNIQQDKFIKVEGPYGAYYKSPFGHVSYPQRQPINTEHMLPIKYIPLLLEIAILSAKPIALGIYMQIFGGLRVGELMNSRRASTLRNFKNGNLLVKLESANLRSDLKNTSGSNYTKKNRTQIVLQVHDWGNTLFLNHIKFYKDTDGSGALFVNRDGRAMTAESYRQYFTKVKKTMVDFLQAHGSPQDKIVAYHLNSSSWSTHIGRGTFTNILADEVDNAFDLAFMRGDSNLLSSLAYMTNTERMRIKIENKFKEMHGTYIPKLIDRY